MEFVQQVIALNEFKSFVRRELGRYPIIRQLILEEPDNLHAQEFVVRCKVWLQVLEKEIEASESPIPSPLDDRPVVRK